MSGFAFGVAGLCLSCAPHVPLLAGRATGVVGGSTDCGFLLNAARRSRSSAIHCSSRRRATRERPSVRVSIIGTASRAWARMFFLLARWGSDPCDEFWGVTCVVCSVVFIGDMSAAKPALCGARFCSLLLTGLSARPLRCHTGSCGVDWLHDWLLSARSGESGGSTSVGGCAGRGRRGLRGAAFSGRAVLRV